MVALIDKLMAQRSRAIEMRAFMEADFRDVSDLVTTTREFSPVVPHHTSRRRSTRRVYNDKARRGYKNLAAAMHGLMSNPQLRWIEFLPTDESLRDNVAVMDWCYLVSTTVMNWLRNTESGFELASHELYKDLIAFGTALMAMKRKKRKLIFQALSLQGVYLLQDVDGKITWMFRHFRMTAEEMVNEFGLENCSLQVQEEFKHTERRYTPHVVCQVVYPRQPDERKGMKRMKPWASVHFEPDEKKIMQESGFNRRPVLTPRWETDSESPWGGCPSIDALPSIRGVNVMERNVQVAGEMAIAPPVMAQANSIEGTLNLNPRSIIYVKQGTREFPRPMETAHNPLIGETLIQDREAGIGEHYFLDKLQLPELSRMTAEEVATRRAQGLLTFASPIVTRLLTEFLRPGVIECLKWMMETNQIPERPEELRGRGLVVDFTSPLVQAQKSNQGEAFGSATQAAAPIIQADPDVFGVVVNTEKAVRGIYLSKGVPPAWLNNAKERRAQRQKKDEQAAAAQEAQLLQAGGRAARDFAVAGQTAAEGVAA